MMSRASIVFGQRLGEIALVVKHVGHLAPGDRQVALPAQIVGLQRAVLLDHRLHAAIGVAGGRQIAERDLHRADQLQHKACW